MAELTPKAYQKRLPGGEHPEVGRLFQETLQDFQDHFADYLLAGLGQYVVTLVVVFASIIGGYVIGMVGGFVGVLGVAVLVGGLQSSMGDDTAALLAIPLQLTLFLGLFVAAAGFGAVIGAILGPINASLTRAVAAHQRGDKKLTPMASFETVGERWTSAATAGFLLAGLAVVGLMMCYLPALLVPLLFGFGGSLAALHPLGGMRALALSARHVLAYPAWALPFGLISVVIALVAGNVPILGGAFATAFHVRAHRYVFGDGEDPVLSIAGSSSGDTKTQ
jgi:hypothetical protein